MTTTHPPTPVALHVTEPDLLGLLAHDLPLVRLADVAAHTRTCRRCAGRVAEASAFRRSLAGALATLPATRSASITTPVGRLVVTATEHGISRVAFAEAGVDPVSPAAVAAADPLLGAVRQQLEEYFAGRREQLDVPLDLRSVGPFQRTVLAATARIPAGGVSTYAQVAQSVGRSPRAARAVGGALNRNPVPLLVPCHRVVGARGDLVGYVGGVEAKRLLLRLEGALPAA